MKNDSRTVGNVVGACAVALLWMSACDGRGTEVAQATSPVAVEVAEMSIEGERKPEVAEPAPDSPGAATLPKSPVRSQPGPVAPTTHSFDDDDETDKPEPWPDFLETSDWEGDGSLPEDVRVEMEYGVTDPRGTPWTLKVVVGTEATYCSRELNPCIPVGFEKRDKDCVPLADTMSGPAPSRKSLEKLEELARKSKRDVRCLMVFHCHYPTLEVVRPDREEESSETESAPPAIAALNRAVEGKLDEKSEHLIAWMEALIANDCNGARTRVPK